MATLLLEILRKNTPKRLPLRCTEAVRLPTCVPVSGALPVTIQPPRHWKPAKIRNAHGYCYSWYGLNKGGRKIHEGCGKLAAVRFSGYTVVLGKRFAAAASDRNQPNKRWID
nr:hypothetical protein [Pseudomonas sp.]